MELKQIEAPSGWEDIKYHEYCTMFPEASETEFDQVVGSMEKNGFLISDPIILIENQEDGVSVILDGRTRHQAALEARVTPTFLLFNDEDALGFVCSRNLDRRHLSPGQRAALGADIANLKGGQNPMAEGDVSVDEAAKICGSSSASIKRYRTIRSRDPEVAETVRLGMETLNSAWEKVKNKAEPGGGGGQKPSEAKEAKPLPESMTPDPDEPKGSEGYVAGEDIVPQDTVPEEDDESPVPAKPYVPPTVKVTLDRGPFQFPSDEQAPIIAQVGKTMFRLDKQAAAHLGKLLTEYAER